MGEKVKGASLAAYILLIIEKRGITREEFARRVGLSRAGFYKLLDKLTGREIGELRLSTLIKLARGLEMPYLALIQELTGASHGSTHAKGEPFMAGDAFRLFEDSGVNIPTMCCGAEFVQRWMLHNTGAVPWRHRRMVCLDSCIFAMRPGARCGTALVFPKLLPFDNELPIEPTAPEETAVVQTRFHAPSNPGMAVSYWKMVNLEGEFCFPGLADAICVIQARKD